MKFLYTLKNWLLNSPSQIKFESIKILYWWAKFFDALCKLGFVVLFLWTIYAILTEAIDGVSDWAYGIIGGVIYLIVYYLVYRLLIGLFVYLVNKKQQVKTEILTEKRPKPFVLMTSESSSINHNLKNQYFTYASDLPVPVRIAAFLLFIGGAFYLFAGLAGIVGQSFVEGFSFLFTGLLSLFISNGLAKLKTWSFWMWSILILFSLVIILFSTKTNFIDQGVIPLVINVVLFLASLAHKRRFA